MDNQEITEERLREWEELWNELQDTTPLPLSAVRTLDFCHRFSETFKDALPLLLSEVRRQKKCLDQAFSVVEFNIFKSAYGGDMFGFSIDNSIDPGTTPELVAELKRRGL